MKDSYYTSSDLADILVGYVSKEQIKTVVDFCVGGGELLRAANKRWKTVKCYGTDISKEAIDILKKDYPNWGVDICDFTSEEQRNNTSVLKRKFDLVLLNPPFTCKGSAINVILYNGNEFHVSTSMLFLVEGLKYLKIEGEVCAIMPISTLYSQKDKKIWNELRKKYTISIHKESEKQYFKDCSPSVALISLKKGCTNETSFHPLSFNIGIKTDVKILRGKLSMFKIKKQLNGLPLVHTTNIRSNKLILSDNFVEYPSSQIEGPAVLIPRVGNPSSGKICIIPEKESYIISDCIIGLQTNTIDESKTIMDILLANWNDFRSLYKGTGAKYITIERIREYLQC